MKKSIEKARFNYKSMVEGGAYSKQYLESQKKLYIAELINENKAKVQKFRDANTAKLEALKKKYSPRTIGSDDLHRFENKLKAMNIKGLESVLTQTISLAPDEIYAVLAEMRARDGKVADKYIELVEARNMLHPYKNDSEYKKLTKEDAAIKIFEVQPERHYEIESDDPTNIKGFTELDKTLD